MAYRVFAMRRVVPRVVPDSLLAAKKYFEAGFTGVSRWRAAAAPNFAPEFAFCGSNAGGRYHKKCLRRSGFVGLRHTSTTGPTK